MGALPFLVVFIILWITYYITKRWKYYVLPSAGIPLPFLGHFHILATKEAQVDPTGFMWNLWKRSQKRGMMFLKVFNMKMIQVGDFETLKYIYNHPECQLRMTGTGMDWATREDRKVKSEEIPGVILSEGKTWIEQRR